MADSTVKIENMPAQADSGSPARVAWDLFKFMHKLLPAGDDSEVRIRAYLDLYADCHRAARGHRDETR